MINVAILKACTRNNVYLSTVSNSNTDMDRLDDRYTIKLSYIRNERLDILGTYKEPHEALLEILRFCHSRLGHR